MDATFDSLESLQEDIGILLYMWESNERTGLHTANRYGGTAPWAFAAQDRMAA